MTPTNGYATLAELKLRLWPTGTLDATYDSALDQLITAASRRIDETCSPFRFYAASETRTFKAEFADLLFIPTGLLSVTTLRTDEDGDRVYERTWATTDYDLEPENAALDGKPYTRLATTPNGLYQFPVGVPKGVQLAGSFGYATTAPALIAEACLLQSMRWWKRKDAIFGVVGSAEMGQLVVIPKLDPDVELMLRPFMRGLGQMIGV